MTKHKWHKEIKAWADGAEIEQIYTYANLNFDSWEQVYSPCWYEDNAKFRIKQQLKEPQYLYVFKSLSGNFSCRTERNAFEYIGEYLGKIKLEVDDDTSRT